MYWRNSILNKYLHFIKTSFRPSSSSLSGVSLLACTTSCTTHHLRLVLQLYYLDWIHLGPSAQCFSFYISTQTQKQWNTAHPYASYIIGGRREHEGRPAANTKLLFVLTDIRTHRWQPEEDHEQVGGWWSKPPLYNWMCLSVAKIRRHKGNIPTRQTSAEIVVIIESFCVYHLIMDCCERTKITNLPLSVFWIGWIWISGTCETRFCITSFLRALILINANSPIIK